MLKTMGQERARSLEEIERGWAAVYNYGGHTKPAGLRNSISGILPKIPSRSMSTSGGVELQSATASAEK